MVLSKRLRSPEAFPLVSPRRATTFRPAFLVLTGTATLSNYQTALASIRYNNSSNVPSTTSRVIQIYVNDGEIDSNIAESTIAVSAVNDPPTASNFTATTLEDSSWVAQLSDFTSVYSDPESTPLASITITSLATAGTLEFYNGTSWVSVTVNQVITAASLTSGFLRLRPVANANGTNYARFSYTVSDGTASSSSGYTVTVNVTPVNDAPVLTAGSLDSGYGQRRQCNHDRRIAWSFCSDLWSWRWFRRSEPNDHLHDHIDPILCNDLQGRRHNLGIGKQHGNRRRTPRSQVQDGFQCQWQRQPSLDRCG